MSDIPYHFDDPKHVENISVPVDTGEQSAKDAVELETPKEMSADEEAAMKFTKLLPYAKKFAKNMNGGGLARVFNAMMEFPLGAQQPKFINEAERQLFFVAQELNGYKSTVIQSIIKNSQMMPKPPTEINDTGTEVKKEN